MSLQLHEKRRRDDDGAGSVEVHEYSSILGKGLSPDIDKHLSMSADPVIAEGVVPPVKTFPYVPPRIDPDLYQASVPEWQEPPRSDGKCVERKRKSNKDIAVKKQVNVRREAGCSALHSADQFNWLPILGFVAATRNIVDSVRPMPGEEGFAPITNEAAQRREMKCSADTSTDTCSSKAIASGEADVKTFESIPSSVLHGSNPVVSRNLWTVGRTGCTASESDAPLLEYIGRHDNDVDRGWYHLSAELSHGKGLFHADKASGFVGHTASSMLFTEWKERQLQLRTTTFPLGYLHKPQQLFLEEDISASVPYTGDSFVAPVKINEILPTRLITCAPASVSKRVPDDCAIDIVDSEDASIASSTMVNHGAPSEDRNDISSSGRQSLQRGAGKHDKLGIRRRWVLLLHRVSQFLKQADSSNRCTSAVSGKSSSSMGSGFLFIEDKCSDSDKGLSSSGADAVARRPSVAEAQNLLEEVASVGTSFSEVAAIGTQFATTDIYNAAEETALFDSARSLLGDLVKAVMLTRCWLTEIDDAIFSAKPCAWDWDSGVGVISQQQPVTKEAQCMHFLLNDSSSQEATLPHLPSLPLNELVIRAALPKSTQRTFYGLMSLLKKEEGLRVTAPLGRSHFYQKAMTSAVWLLKVTNVMMKSLILWEKNLLFGISCVTGVDQPPIETMKRQMNSLKMKLLAPYYLRCGNIDSCFNDETVEEAQTFNVDDNHIGASGNESRTICDDFSKEFSDPVKYSLSASSCRDLMLGTSVSQKEESNTTGFDLLTLMEFESVLSAACSCPLKVKEMPYVYTVYYRANVLNHAAATVLSRFNNNNNHRRACGVHSSASFDKVEADYLLMELSRIPLLCPTEQPLREMLQRAERWSKEVLSMRPDLNSSPTNTAGAADDKPVPLKKIEVLINEGERFPFNFATELEILKDKKALAKVWLEKFKKSIVPSKSLAQRRAQSHAGAGLGAITLKPTLTDMRQIADVGDILYQPFDEQNLHSADLVLTEANASENDVEAAEPGMEETTSKSAVAGSNRDLMRIHAVVESAEEWISRAKDIMLTDEEEQMLLAVEGDNMMGAVRSWSGSFLCNNEFDGSSGGDDAIHRPRATVDEMESDEEDQRMILKAMLDEADAMPVEMEETIIIRSHLNALDWAKKVRPLLSQIDNALGAREHESDARRAEESVLTTFDCRGEGNHPRPRLVELRQFAKEITSIRSKVPEHLKQSMPIRPLTAETMCLDLVTRGERLIGRIKKMMQGNSIRRGVHIDKLRQLQQEGHDLGVNIDYEMRPVRSAIETFEKWVLDNSSMLQRLIPAPVFVAAVGDSPQMPPSEPTSEWNHGSEMKIVKRSVESDVDVASKDNAQEEGVDPIYYHDLELLVDQGMQLIAESELMKSLTHLKRDIDRWMVSVDRLCGKKKKLRENSCNNSSFEEVQRNPSRKRSRCSTDVLPESLASADEINSAAEASAINSSQPIDAAATDDASGEVLNIEASTKLLKFEDIEKLIHQGLNFPIDTSEHIQQLRKVTEEVKTNAVRVEEYVSHRFTIDVQELTNVHRDILRCDIDVQRSILFCWYPTSSRDQTTERSERLLKCASDIKEAIGEMQREEVLLGVELTSRQNEKFHFYDGCILWINEAISLVTNSRVIRRRAKSRCKATWEWEYVRDLQPPLGGWGDVDAHLILALLREGDAILKNFGALKSTFDFTGSAVENPPSLDEIQHNEDFVNAKSRPRSPSDEHHMDVTDAVANETISTRQVGSRKRKQRFDESVTTGAATQSQQQDLKRTRTKSKSASKIKNEPANSEHLKRNGRSEKSEKRPLPPCDEFLTNRMRKFVDLLESRNMTRSDIDSDSTEVYLPKDLLYVVFVWQNCLLLLARQWCKAQRWARAAAALLEGAMDLTNLESLKSMVDDTRSSLIELEPASDKNKIGPPVQESSIKDFASTDAKELRGCDEGASDPNHSHVGPELGNEATLVKQMLVVADFYGIQMKRRDQLEERFESSKEWVAKVSALREGSATSVTVEVMDSIVTEGERMVFSCGREEELQYCRTQLQAAKSWIKKLERSGILFDNAYGSENGSDEAPASGATDGDAPIQPSMSAQALEEMLREAKSIRCIDLSSYVDRIEQANECYCLCRQLYFGQMIGCDHCDDWYHLTCVGVSLNQAEKCDKYTCIRCAIKKSYASTAERIADVCNKWMNSIEHFRARETIFQKLMRKINKEEKDVQRAELALQQLFGAKYGADQAMTKISQLRNSNLSGFKRDSEKVEERSQEIATSVTNATENGDLDCSEKCEFELERHDFQVAHAALAKALEEKQRLLHAIALEKRAHRDIARWMQKIQDVIWPVTQEQIEIGRPLGLYAIDVKSLPNSPSSALRAAKMLAAYQTLQKNPLSISARNRLLISHLHDPILPVGMLSFVQEAEEAEIAEIDDVVNVIGHFKWMSWCSLCLCMLQLPPPTPALRRLIDAARKINNVDEKIIKQLSAILQRSCSWKIKAKKTFNSQMKKLDKNKLLNTSIEGNSLPFTSRLKESLQHAIKIINENDAPQNKRSSGKLKSPSVDTMIDPKETVQQNHSGEDSKQSAQPPTRNVIQIIQEGYNCASSDEEDIYEEAIELQLQHQLLLQNQHEYQQSGQESYERYQATLAQQRHRIKQLQDVMWKNREYKECLSKTMAKNSDLKWPVSLNCSKKLLQETNLLDNLPKHSNDEG